jgi:hypothetical protein
MEETDSGKDYRGCCPAGFTPFGFWSRDAGDADQPFNVNCVEDAPGLSARGVVYVSAPASWDDGTEGGGTWTGGIYAGSSCARDIVVDHIDVQDYNPPDDFRGCCPEGYDAVGGADYDNPLAVTCLQRR